MSSRAGFTLIESVVSTLVGAVVVITVGGLGERLIHHRVTTDSNSAAMSLAERQMETLLADPVLNPTGGQCPSAKLCSGAHGPTSVDINLSPSSSGLYRVRWTVVDASTAQNSPLITSSSASPSVGVDVKSITVTVTHLRNPQVNATIVRFYKVS